MSSLSVKIPLVAFALRVTLPPLAPTVVDVKTPAKPLSVMFPPVTSRASFSNLMADEAVPVKMILPAVVIFPPILTILPLKVMLLPTKLSGAAPTIRLPGVVMVRLPSVRAVCIQG